LIEIIFADNDFKAKAKDIFTKVFDPSKY